MAKNILLATDTYLVQTLGMLDQYEDYVFWIRDREMTKQIYQGKNFEKIWQRDPEIVFKYPLMWLDFLETSRKDFYMQQLQSRHNENYNDPELNLIYYRIRKPNDANEWIIDNCFKCIDSENVIYIVGMSKRISEKSWHAIDEDKNNIHHEIDKKVEKALFEALKLHFGMIKFEKNKFDSNSIDDFQEKILVERIIFSKREIECLYHCCLGYTVKEIAKIIAISPRTVETYIEHIKAKVSAKSKVDVVAKFSKYILPSD